MKKLLLISTLLCISAADGTPPNYRMVSITIDSSCSSNSQYSITSIYDQIPKNNMVSFSLTKNAQVTVKYINKYDSPELKRSKNFPLDEDNNFLLTCKNGNIEIKPET